MVNDMNGKWYNIKEPVINIKNQTKTVDMYLLDEIGGYGIYAKNFIKELNSIDADTINLQVDSVGGNITDGIAIYNALRGHKAEVNVYVNGIAGSIASIIILAGDKIYIPENAGIFLHLPMYAEMDYPNREDMKEAIEVLGNFEKVLTKTYMKHTGKDEDYIRGLLEAETWMFGQDAVDFIGDQAEVVEKIAMVARIKDLEKYPFSASLPRLSDGEQDEPKVNNMKDEIKAEVTEEVVEAPVEEATEEVVEEAVEEVVDSSSPEPDHEEAVDAIIDADLERLAEEEQEEEVEEEDEEVEEALACEKERVGSIIALAEKYAVDSSVALKAVADDLSVSEFKDSILDVLAKAPTTKKIVSSPEAKASIGDLREQLENATDPRQKYLLAKQIKSLR